MKYEDQTRRHLQEELRKRELPTSGSKQALIERLGAADQDRLLSLRRDDLRAELRERGLSVAGTKVELVERLAAADAEQAEPDEAELADEAVEGFAEKSAEELYESVATAAQQFVGSLSERGVAVDLIVSAFRSAGQAVAQQPGAGDRVGRAAAGERDSPTYDDRSIIDRLIAVFSAVVGQGGDAEIEATAGQPPEHTQGLAEDTDEALFENVWEVQDEVDDLAVDLADVTEGDGAELSEGAARLRAALRAQGLSVEGPTDDLVESFVGAFEDAAESDDDADENERLVDALHDRGVSLEGEPGGLIARIVAAFEQTADDMRGQAREAGEQLEQVQPEPATSTEDEPGAPGAGDDAGLRVVDGGTGDPRQLVRRAAQQLEGLSGRRADGVSSFRPERDGWRITFELVEISRVPPTLDVLGSYEAIVDGDGYLSCYERVSRYIRGQAGQDIS